MKKRKFLLVGYLVTGLYFWGMSQNTYVGNYVIPPSPDASALVRAVNTPVDKYSGTANVNIPLHTISFRDLSVPIALNYHASGIKVEDMATTVGLGWQLSAGGKITRVVRHYPDEKGYSALTNNHGSQVRNVSSWTTKNFDSRLKDYDTEPDLFYFEIPGRSGMFIVDYDHKAYTIPYQCLSIQWVNNEYFVIMDENGVKYTFGKTTASREETQTTVKEESINKDMNFVSTWNLDEIESSVGNKINFTYTAGTDYEFTMYNSKMLLKYHDVVDDDPAKHFLIEIDQTVNMDTKVKIKSPKYLSKIQWSTGSLDFIHSGGRTDLPNALKLSEIRINSYNLKSSYLRSVKFEYSSFYNNALKLDKVSEVKDSFTRLVGRFEYYSHLSVIAQNSFAYDRWGYYNGAVNNNKGYPTISIYSGRLEGDNQNPDITCTSVYSIKRIYYATGVYKEFEYDAHQSVDGNIVGGLRISKIREKDPRTNKELVTSYVYSDEYDRPGGVCFKENPEYLYLFSYVPAFKKIRGIKVGYNLYYCVCHYKSMNALSDVNGVIVGYPKVKEILPNGGYTVYHFQSYRDAPDESHRTYSIIDGKYMSFLNNHTPHTSKFWQRGRLKSKITYDAAGNEISKITVSYKPVTSSKKEIIGCVPYYSGEGMKFEGGFDLRIPMMGVYKWMSQPAQTDTIRTEGKGQPALTTVYKYHPDYLVPVETSTTNTAINFTTKETYTYPFQYDVDNAGSSCAFSYALKCMNRDHIINAPVETVQYRYDKIAGGTIHEYKVISANDRTECVVPAQIRELKTATPISAYTPYVINSTGVSKVDSHYEVTSYMDNYSSTGNPMSIHEVNKNVKSMFYDNDGRPIAWVENAARSGELRQSEVAYTSFESSNLLTEEMNTAKSGIRASKEWHAIYLSGIKPEDYRLTYWISADKKKWEKIDTVITILPKNGIHLINRPGYYIDEVRMLLPKARMKTCTYDESGNKTSETDFNGQTIYYEYDCFGRLIRVRDNERHLLKEYKYNIVNN